MAKATFSGSKQATAHVDRIAREIVEREHAVTHLPGTRPDLCAHCVPDAERVQREALERRRALGVGA